MKQEFYVGKRPSLLVFNLTPEVILRRQLAAKGRGNQYVKQELQHLHNILKAIQTKHLLLAGRSRGGR
jgi:hypothetical protein